MSLITQKTIYKHMWSKGEGKSQGAVWMVQWMNASDPEKPNETDRRWYTKLKAPGRLVYYWAVSRIPFEVGPRKGRPWKYIQREGPHGKLKKEQGPGESRFSRNYFKSNMPGLGCDTSVKPKRKQSLHYKPVPARRGTMCSNRFTPS